MKILLLPCALILLTLASVHAQPFNQEINASNENPMLLGKINKEALSSNSYASWYSKNFEEYKPDAYHLAKLKPLLTDYTIKVFMGTWCGDSKKEVPRFYKVMEAAEFPMERISMVALDRAREDYKQSPGGEEEGLNIHRVPTFIFYKDGEEVNRIVEHPVKAFEEDILQLLTSEYTPNYHAVTVVNDFLTTMGLKKFKRKSRKIISKIKPISKKTSELNTFSSVVFYANKQEEGIEVARLNTLLFPEEASTFTNLGNKLFRANKKIAAKVSYEKALALDPENEQAKNGLNTLTEDLQ